MNSRVIYREARTWNTGKEQPSCQVTLLKVETPEIMNTCYLLHGRSVTDTFDGDFISDYTVLLNQGGVYATDAQMVREAIRRFDILLAQHPTPPEAEHAA